MSSLVLVATSIRYYSLFVIIYSLIEDRSIAMTYA